MIILFIVVIVGIGATTCAFGKLEERRKEISDENKEFNQSKNR